MDRERKSGENFRKRVYIQTWQQIEPKLSSPTSKTSHLNYSITNEIFQKCMHFFTIIPLVRNTITSTADIVTSSA
jgi:hypothetical protein